MMSRSRHPVYHHINQPRKRVGVVEMGKKRVQKGRNGWNRVNIQKCHIPNASKPTTKQQ